LTFFVVAIVAALLGFNQVAGPSAGIDRLFAILAVVFLLIYLLVGRMPAAP
jgi:uncharacterized membrane protein YtjA (UPF0391 family)